MKNKTLKYSIVLIIFGFLLSSCGQVPDSNSVYPKYSLDKIEYIPDSLKDEHREWIKETIRAASQYMTGGDYENVNVTIKQAKWTADELFSVEVIGLRKQINSNSFDDLKLAPSELSEKETKIIDSLLK